MKRYDAFISYSQRADARVARQLELGLKNMARQWNQLRALEVFRDETSLSASPDLWQTIAKQLDSVDYTIVLLSPEAVESPWVGREIDHFLSSQEETRLLLALTAGHLAWDSESKDWTADSTAVPEELRGRLEDEPLWVDLRWTRSASDLRWRDPILRSAVATLAAPIHGKSKDELEGEDLRAHSKFLWIRRVAIVAMLLLVAAAAWQTNTAVAAGRQTVKERSLRQEVENVNKALDETNTALAKSNTDLDNVNDQLEVSNGELDQANKKLTSTNEELDETNQDLDRSNDELEESNQKLDETNAALEESNEALGLANLQLGVTNDELDDANNQLNETNDALSSTNKQLDGANAQLKQAAADLTRLEEFASRSAGLSVCSQAQAGAAAQEQEYFQQQISEYLGELSAWQLRMSEMFEQGEPTIDEVQRSFEELGFVTVVGVPPVAPWPGGNPTCSELPGFPFRDHWSTIGDPLIIEPVVQQLPNCREIFEARGLSYDCDTP